MRELDVNEIKDVNGGIYQYFVGWLVGHALDSAITNWKGSSEYREFDDSRLAP